MYCVLRPMKRNSYTCKYRYKS